MQMENFTFDTLPKVVSQILDKVTNLENMILNNGLTTQQDKNKKEIYTAKETAEYLNVTLPTIHAWAKKGKLTKHKIGGTRIGFKRAEVEKLLIKVEARKR